MRILGILVVVAATALLFVGYSKRADHTITLTTPEGYAAPTAIPRTSWKDSIPEMTAAQPADEKPLLVLEMEKPKPAVAKTVKPSAKRKIVAAKRGKKRVASRPPRYWRPSLARR